MHSKFFYCCVIIHCQGNDFTVSLPSNDRFTNLLNSNVRRIQELSIISVTGAAISHLDSSNSSRSP
jgi:hypothetical protein